MEGNSLPICVAELDRLRRLIEGLLDADILLFEEGSALLRPLAAARTAVDGGEVRAARRHTRRFCRAIEALVESGAIEEAAGREALAASQRALGDLSG